MPRHPESLTASPAGSGLLDAPTAAAALAVASAVGARLADPARVAEAVAAASGQTAHPASVHWRDHAVGQGHAGLALLFGALHQHDPDQGWDRTAHQHLALAARAAEALPRPPAGLFAGLAGLGLVAASLSGDGTRYRHLLATVDQALAARVPALAGVAGAPGRAGGLAVRDVDLISGLTGVGAYLLLRREAPGVAGALPAVLGSLVELTGSDRSGPRWRTPPDQLSPDERARYPDGYLNCGLAHGIPGPLAVLSLALRAGIDLPGLPDAVARTAAWLAAHRTSDPSGPTWPNAVPLPGPAGATAPVPAGPARAAWCYGGPGVAAALRLAGDALGPAGTGYHDLAMAALAGPVGNGGPGSPASSHGPDGEGRLSSPTFCHGRAGLLAVASTVARATGDDGFRRAAAGLAAGLLARFDPAAPLGYRDLETGGRLIDQPGLLTGAPGVALALLGAASPAEPAWARLFLLA